MKPDVNFWIEPSHGYYDGEAPMMFGVKETTVDLADYPYDIMGKQSPGIGVVQKPELIAKLSKMNAAVMGSSNDPFYGAPTVLIVLADPEIGTYHEDGSLVMGNLMLAAHAVGVDSCWIHRAKEEFESAEGKELLKEWGLPENLVGIGHCILGYRDCEYPEAKKRKANYIVRV